MPTITQKVWLTFEAGRQNEPCLWKMTQAFPKVQFDIRQASVQADIGIMAVLFTGEEADVDGSLALLKKLGVKVDPVVGGDLVAG